VASGRGGRVLNGVLLAGVAGAYGLWFGCRLVWVGLCLPGRLARRCRRGTLR